MQHLSILIPTTFSSDGFALLAAAIPPPRLDDLASALETSRPHQSPRSAPGIRHLLTRCPPVRAFATSPPALGKTAERRIPTEESAAKRLDARRASGTSPERLHTIITIPVARRADAPGFGPWSTKGGIVHVQPPAAVLARMVPLRVHIDDCPADNGAIKFIPGSHTSGILDASRINDWKSSHPTVSCPAIRCDVIVMCPLILHSSSHSDSPARRRVLHIEYAADLLPYGLEWTEA